MLTSALVLVLLTGAPAAPQVDGTLNPRWLADDERMLKAVLTIFVEPPDQVKRVARRLGLEVDRPGEGDLGLGYRLTRLVRGGGYAHVTFTILHDSAGRIVAGDLWIRGGDAWPELSRRFHLAEVPTAFAEGGPDWARYEFRDAAGLERLERRFRDHFGGQQPAEVPQELAADFRLLSDPLQEDAYGLAIGLAGVTPRSRSAVGRILAAGRRDLLRAVASSPNPQGRLYAIEALHWPKLDGIGAADPLATSTARLAATVYVCRGCICSTERVSSVAGIRELIASVRPPSAR